MKKLIDLPARTSINTSVLNKLCKSIEQLFSIEANKFESLESIADMHPFGHYGKKENVAQWVDLLSGDKFSVMGAMVYAGKRSNEGYHCTVNLVVNSDDGYVEKHVCVITAKLWCEDDAYELAREMDIFCW